MEHSEVSLLPLVVVTVLAFLVPLLVLRIPRITIPVVVGELIAGILVGPSGLGIVDENIVLTVLAELGFVYLMFLSGLEIDFSALGGSNVPGAPSKAKLTANPLVIGGVTFGAALLIAGSFSYILREWGLIEDFYIMALILSTTSLGIVVPVLKERGLSRGPYGQSILVSALFADFLTILLISFYVLLRTEGFSGEIVLILAFFAVFLATYRIAEVFQRHLPAERILEELSSATSQLKLRGSFALALIFVALAETLGIESILGAFLAGVIISLLSGDHDTTLREKQDAIGYGFLIPIFFVMVGVGFDLPALLDSSRALALVPILVGLAYIVKFVPALVFRLNYSWRETFAAGSLLSSRLSLIIAASAIGLELGVISGAINSAIILVAIITVTISPVAFNRILPGKADEPDRVIILGSHPVGELLAQRLRGHGIEVALILDGGREDSSDEDGSAQEMAGVRDALRDAEIERATAVISMVRPDGENLRICRIARTIFHVEHVFAWVLDPTMNERYRRLGVQVVNPSYTTAMVLESMVLNPSTFEGLADIDAHRGIRTVKLRNEALIGRRVRDLNLEEEDYNVLLVERNGTQMVPDDGANQQIMLQANDLVTIVGDEDDIDEITRHFARETRRRTATK